MNDQANVIKLHPALRYAKTGALLFNEAVLPYKSPIDKILAYTLLDNVNDTRLKGIRYWRANECPIEQFGKWRDEGVYAVDIGDRKYHDAGVQSASEFFLKEFGLDDAENGITGGFAKLVKMINRNNKNGYLKNFPFAVAGMLREMYELSEQDSFHFMVIEAARDVLESYALVENGEIARSLDGLTEALPELVTQLSVCNDHPLSLGLYLKHLWLLGTETSEIVRKVHFWLNGKTEYDARVAAAAEAFKTLTRDWFKAGDFKGIVIKRDDVFLTKAVIANGEYEIRIIVRSSGHVTISSNKSKGVDLTKVAEELSSKEPGRWYFGKDMGALINGGPQYTAIEPTQILTSHIIGMLQTHLKPLRLKENRPNKKG